MSIFDDINILKGHIALASLFNTADNEAIKPMYEAMKRVAEYAHKCAKKEFLDGSMETLEKIMKGEKLQ